MNSEQIKHQLVTLTYTDNTDAVALRYVLLHALAGMAGQYMGMKGSDTGLQLLQQHKKLEEVHSHIKEKLRSNKATKDDFILAKSVALKCIENCMLLHAYVAAA